LISFSSVTGFPSLPIMGFCVCGSIFSTSCLILNGDGAMILIPFCPFITLRPKLFFQAEKPATREASGFCMAISSVLLKL